MQQSADSSGGRVVGRLHTSDQTARVTTFELFFDLVYVFAFTQVTGLMAETHSAFGILQALIVLGLLWWTWVSYCWLANQAPADQPVMRVGMSLAMIAVFVIGLTVPEAYDDLEGGLGGPLVLAVAYTLVRLIHGVLYLVAAGDDRALRRQVLITEAVAMAPAATALLVGALIGGPAQTWIWLGAFLYDFVLTYVSSRGGGAWRIYSPAHWSERHGLVVILALGESIVAIGVGVAQEAIDWAIIVGAALAVTLAILSWSAYFTRDRDRRRARTGTANGCRTGPPRHERVHLPALRDRRGGDPRSARRRGRDGPHRRRRAVRMVRRSSAGQRARALRHRHGRLRTPRGAALAVGAGRRRRRDRGSDSPAGIDPPDVGAGRNGRSVRGRPRNRSDARAAPTRLVSTPSARRAPTSTVRA